MLRPIVRQLIAYGISYPAFSQIVKQLYVEVAEREFALPFKRQTDSRLALVTGVHRKEIARLREPRTGETPLEVEDTIVTHVLGRWMAGPPYSERDGTPRRIPYESAHAKSPSFTRLVRDMSVDIPVRSVLDELLHVGAVDLLPSGEVVLRSGANIPAQDIGAKLTLLGSDPAELFTTIVHNIEQPQTPHMQRKVVYDNIGSDALDELRTAARHTGEEFIRHANALLASYDRDRNAAAPGGTRARVVLGAYYFEEETEPTDPPRASATQRRAPGRIRRSR